MTDISSSPNHSRNPVARSLKIAAIGDVHDLWDDQDAIALRHLGVDLVLLVGDFGNESVDVVRSVAAIDLPKAVILGNHDAWYTATEWGRKKCPYDRQQEDRVTQQLELLGAAHVGYGKLDLPELGLSVVGARPFSWGGSTWKHGEFYQQRFGISSYAESIDRIVEAVDSTLCDTVIFIGHCGPTGLGDRPEDPCGQDWKPIGGDHGDPDFAAAIAAAQRLGKRVPLVAFGHMHHHLRHTKAVLRKAIEVSPDQKTVYLNAARVPRIKDEGADRLRNFSIVEMQAGVVAQASLVWLNRQMEVHSEEILYKHPHPVVQSASSESIVGFR